MPAAIDRDLLMACKYVKKDDRDGTCTIRIANVDDVKFPAEELSYKAGKDGPELDSKAHSWVNYFKAGLKGVLSHITMEKTAWTLELNILTDGNVPPGGGLSSSAAMVVSSALLLLVCYDEIHITTQGQLATIAIDSERLVGVDSGGMDQSASIFSKRDHLLNVGFVPKLVVTLVKFPEVPALSYVVANTLVTSEKQKTAKFNYNLRVVEMRVAAAILAHKLDLDMPTTMPTPKHIMDAYFQSPLSHPSQTDFLKERQRRLGIMLDVVERIFGANKEQNSWSEVYESLGGITAEMFKETFHPSFEIEAKGLKLYKRAKHAYSEARRVYQYRGLLEGAERSDTGLAEKLGNLMNDSQTSCRDLFECSCPEIDEVCRIARASGSLGSRVSGAGWGGCTVHLVPQKLERMLIEALKKEYYATNFPNLSNQELQEAVFATRPEEGACLYLL
ncbi:MAG: galactokinase [Cyphobasidiales sp. Tagirdzhanova-0007]|nr:MAG: galactokinase [Cyphobasidiales sp. Tagirdzhanova-0007]